MSVKVIRGGTVTSPQGFLASGLHCGIKAKTRKLDLALITSENPAVSAGTFTKNRIKAWPVMYSMKAIRKSERHRAIITNSGNANCINGRRGEDAVRQTVKTLARTSGIPEREILICSTGLIGTRLPTLKIVHAIPRLVKQLSLKGGHRAARGILTTDTRAKEMAVAFKLGRKEVRMGGITKGVGMVHPRMGTMLNFLTTDCAISRPLLYRALRSAVGKTYNMMSIDNDVSTNDTVFILANGQAGNRPIRRVDDRYKRFEAALLYLTTHFAREMIKDGEGTTKFCELVVSGVRSKKDGEAICRTIANSMLFKTMLAGADPNWGRIVAAVGASGVPFRFNRMSIAFNGIKLVAHGTYLIRNRPDARRILRRREFTIEVHLGDGKHEARFFTSDLTKGYVHINASYST